MVAPVIGGWIIAYLSWRWIFVLHVLLGLLSITGVWLMDESLGVLSKEKLSRAFNSYFRLMTNMNYLLLVLALSCLGIPFFAFIAASSDIYITGLDYTETTFGYFFACNASAFMVAPLTFTRIARHVALEKLLPVSYLGVLGASLLMLVPFIPMPYRFAVPMWLLTFFFAFGRPPGNNLILEQVERDIGAASSLMVFVFFMTGSCSMWFISLDWQDKVRVIGLLGTVSATVTLVSWLLIRRYLKLKLP